MYDIIQRADIVMLDSSAIISNHDHKLDRQQISCDDSVAVVQNTQNFFSHHQRPRHVRLDLTAVPTLVVTFNNIAVSLKLMHTSQCRPQLSSGIHSNLMLH